MGDDSRSSILKSLKKEWSLFWQAFQEEEESTQSVAILEEIEELEDLSFEQTREMTKAIAEDRRKLNQKLESLSKEIELNSAKLESLRLVGASEEDTLKRIHELNDLGQSVSHALTKLDKRLRQVREREDRLHEDILES